jgi:hypothetical protein
MEAQVLEVEKGRQIRRKKSGVGVNPKSISAMSMQQRKILPLVVPDSVMESSPYTIKTNEIGRLMLGDYQRMEVKPHVSMIREAIKRGSMPPPIDVCIRTWDSRDKAKADLLWVADGQQRMWAHIDAGTPIECRIHKVETIEQEKALFLVLNERVKLNAVNIFISHPGPTAELIRLVATDKDHPLFNRVLIARYTGSHEKMQPATVLRGLAVALGVTSSGTSRMLGAVDAAIKGGRKTDALAFLYDLGKITKGRASIDIVTSIGAVWREAGPFKPKALDRLRRLKLANVTGTTPGDRRAAIERRIWAAIEANGAH